MNMVPGATSYRSPKRKRDVIEEAEENTPPASPLSVSSHPELRLLEGEELGRCSPRTAVAGRFKELAIQESVPQSIPIAQWHGPSGSTADNTESSGEFDHLQLSPDKSPNKTNQAEVSNENDLNGELVTKDQAHSTRRSINGSCRTKIKTVSPTKSRRKISPPPEDIAISDSLTWDDSEITGHNPTDPNDDGYGINGIGFRPTAAIAWARSQQRQKQVAEWKNREAREAREKRRERREGASQVKSEYDPGGTTQKKVKFDLR